MKREEKKQYIIYIDTGGTFSDCVILNEDGTSVSGKAPTTPEDLTECFFSSIQATCQNMGEKIEKILANTELIGFGTTAGTNALITRVGGPRLGLITTKGFEDTPIIRKGGARWFGLGAEAMHIAGTDPPDPLINIQMVRGVTERIDSRGDVVIPLYEKEVRQGVSELLEAGAEAIAVITLWSFLNDIHEKKIKEIIEEIAPQIPVSISSEVAPIVRENARFNSTLINLFIWRPVKKIFSKVEDRLKELNYNKHLLAMQGSGGLSRSEVVQPLSTLHSGPVGGLIGSDFFKKLYGYDNAIGSDVGGTSFDITLLPKQGPEFIKEPIISRYPIANPMLAIESIGAGGGTIAYVDELTGVLRVGPRSSGAVPGPCCYDRGGTEPTVTDADVVMNRIDPDYFLGGNMKLNRDKAFKAVKEKIADPMKMDVVEAAYGISRIIDGAMGNILASTLSEKGYRPEDFVLFAFGGAGPTHCAGYSYGVGLNFSRVIIPANASTFSAFGASTADVLHRYEASAYLVIPPGLPFDLTTKKFTASSLDQIPQEFIQRFNDMYEMLEQRGYDDMVKEGFSKDEVKVTYSIEVRYGGQLWEGIFSSPVSRIKSIEDFNALVDAFETEYERLYSRGAMYPEGSIEIITLSVTMTAPTPKPVMVKREFAGKDPAPALKGTKEVFLNGSFVETRVYEMGKLENGNVVEGPAIIEALDTTLIVPPECNVTSDEYLNLIMQKVR